LNLMTYSPYSDFLLHDVGRGGDGISQAGASGREIRTAPLWGAHFVSSFLHDGSANSVKNAILAHAGQAAAARNRFSNLTRTQQAAIVAFVNVLCHLGPSARGCSVARPGANAHGRRSGRMDREWRITRIDPEMPARLTRSSPG